MNVPCTHPGCPATVTLPPRMRGAIRDLAAKVARCDDHRATEPDDSRGDAAAPAPTAESVWANRVDHEIVAHYGRAPRLADLPDDVSGLSTIRQIAAAWPGLCTNPRSGRPLRALILSGAAGTLKTTTAYALLGDIVRSDPGGLSLARHDLVTGTEAALMQDTYNDRGFPVPANLRGVFGRARLVLIDDVGSARYATEGHRHQAWLDAINTIYARNTFLVMTTNLATERALFNHIGAAAFSRLVQMSGFTAPGGFVAPDPNDSLTAWPTPIGMLVVTAGPDRRISPGKVHR